MTRFISFVLRLFGKPDPLHVDELAGAVDLSDTTYCMSLLPPETDEALQ
ncbi:MAG: hypothetical protein ACXW24_08170 [Telluria sp.]